MNNDPEVFDRNDLLALVGTWVGSGHGLYPTIERFAYRERSTFVISPKGFLVYQQTTTDPGGTTPMHAEMGYLRLIDDFGGLEMIVAQPTGIAESHTGRVQRVDASVDLVLRSTSIAATPTAKPVTAVIRNLWLDGHVLSYQLHMAAVGQPMQLHLEAELHRE